MKSAFGVKIYIHNSGVLVMCIDHAEPSDKLKHALCDLKLILYSQSSFFGKKSFKKHLILVSKWPRRPYH